MSDVKPKTDRYSEYDFPLKIIWDGNFPKDLRTAELAMVYFIIVNGFPYKIGRSSAKGGFKSMITFYLKAGFDDPGQNRYVINALIRSEIKKGNKVELYGVYERPKKEKWNSPFGVVEITQKKDDQEMERVCINEFLKRYGKHPIWNFQEKGESVPTHLAESFAKYKQQRIKKL